jgi:NAD(P)H-dependent FMN reductase
MGKVTIIVLTASGPYDETERKTAIAFENKDDREARLSGVTTELFDTRATTLASIARQELESLGTELKLVDFAAEGVSKMNRKEFKESVFLQNLNEQIESSTHILWIVPVWKHQVAVSARALIPLLKLDHLEGKISAFMFVLRGSAQSGYGRSLMQDVMLQFGCWLLPSVIETVHSDFEATQLSNKSVAEQIVKQVRKLIAS